MEQTNPETVIIKDSRFGKGIFITTDLPKNQTLFKITGTPLSFEQTTRLGNKECYCLQVGMDKYIIPDYPFVLSNHSCDPNCAINKHLEFITVRNIDKDEELFWDYSTSMMERHWVIKCECGSPACRHIIKDFDLLPVHLQEKYLNMEVVLPFIKEQLFGLPRIEPAAFLKKYSSGR